MGRHIVKSIERKLGDILERVERLKQMSVQIRTFAEYQQSRDGKDIVERNLQLAIEGCLDIAKIIISQKRLREPKDNKGVFVVLGEAGILSQETVAFMAPMAGTRNILVHGYDKIDDEAIYGVLKKRLKDFDTFLQEIRRNCLSL
jgi:uncharacterized protein YutE (UPF0331/DUF86 family)